MAKIHSRWGLWNAVTAAMTMVISGPALPAELSVDKDIESCRQNPRFQIGGAMIGDCLMEMSETIDREIESALTAGKDRYCLARDREDYQQSQVDWLAYRKRMCDLVERSPDNTPSWVNSAACRLELGKQRLASLRYTNEYGAPRCPKN